MQQSLAIKGCCGKLNLRMEINVKTDNIQRGEGSEVSISSCTDSEDTHLQPEKNQTPANDAVEHITLTGLQERLEVVEKNCSHYFELYKKYRLRWLEENHRAGILEKYAPPNVDSYSPAQI
ncbi:uncharacterized protein F5147DRAFT_657545 [Suillus discolor]|uniref:Uncharacterized protein n=1 Tax=Suillus discolor TaxID=1912936 RepID=A0A9P7JNU8_9AGAM|nr:uncharacterized protein F5147DRAFT_657545 [Suillus discolor]KAG2092932.1 hypothetical protein F5147DRAFT_657545 [Suillus discolor]